jgi:hypothetical protein
MTLLEAITADDQIVLSPAGSDIGQPIDGVVDPMWFAGAFSALAQATVPLTDEQYAELRGIDAFWAQNAERWRSEGRI